jgi:flavin reductase (DIM6/NTAB) family NADH-FMN oxidoreductase RutF
MRYLDIKEIQELERRKKVLLINSLSGYKSANLLGTIDNSGNTNLSIVSSAVHLGADPALMAIVIRPDSTPRHSLENIRQNRYCTLNHVNEDIIVNSHQTSARYQKEVSEFKACNLTEEYLNQFQAPFVKESKLKIALKLVREVDIKENGTILLILSVEGVHFHDQILKDDGSLDLSLINTVAVSGLDTYVSTQKIGRLSYAKPDIQSKWLKE